MGHVLKFYIFHINCIDDASTIRAGHLQRYNDAIPSAWKVLLKPMSSASHLMFEKDQDWVPGADVAGKAARRQEMSPDPERNPQRSSFLHSHKDLG